MLQLGRWYLIRTIKAFVALLITLVLLRCFESSINHVYYVLWNSRLSMDCMKLPASDMSHQIAAKIMSEPENFFATKQDYARKEILKTPSTRTKLAMISPMKSQSASLSICPLLPPVLGECSQEFRA